MANFQIIRDLCAEQNITIRGLADRIGVKENAIHGLIKNGSTKTITVEAIAKVLGVPAGMFFEGWPSGTNNITQSVHASKNIKQVAGNHQEILVEMLREKDRQIAEKDRQIAEKDKQSAGKDKQIEWLLKALDKSQA
jgi:uncharacterized protein HemX